MKEALILVVFLDDYYTLTIGMFLKLIIFRNYHGYRNEGENVSMEFLNYDFI